MRQSSQAVSIGPDNGVYMTSDDGYLLLYDPLTNEFEERRFLSEADMATEELLKSASWTIAEEDATTHAVTMESQCPLKFNSGYGGFLRTNLNNTYIFACYGEGKQDPICLYRLDKTN